MIQKKIQVKSLLLSFLLIFALSACQEEISPTAPKTPPNTGGSGGSGGGDNSHVISSQYQSCFDVLDTSSLDVVTWNIENFPMEGLNSVDLAVEVAQNMYADIIAVQEIRSCSDFEALVSRLDGYEGQLHNVRGGQDIGYIYKTSEIVSVSPTFTIYGDDRDAFPRQPVLMTALHRSGLEVTLINLHLKCCNDGRDRRSRASALLKTYIDTNLSTDNVIVLGDYNDEIFESDDVFSNFRNDSFNYRFTDAAIAQGSSNNWSYPSFPSHLDHIMVTNELFSRIIETDVLKVNNCASSYASILSDHRPVILRLRAD